jgi:hypothetical protein
MSNSEFEPLKMARTQIVSIGSKRNRQPKISELTETNHKVLLPNIDLPGLDFYLQQLRELNPSCEFKIVISK